MRARAFALILLAYAAGLLAASLCVAWLPSGTPLARAFWADVVATCVVFAFSRSFDNSSFYDAYWSVAPVPIAFYWLSVPQAAGADGLRQILVMTLLCAWAARLTWNWARGWSGLDHEDWRYVDKRRQAGSLYWLVSFAGLHMMPTLLVFAGCLALWPALAAGSRPIGALDLLACTVTAGAIALEAVADQQLRRFRLSQPSAEAILETGVWAWCRHPNYLGEIGFWWGLFLFAPAAQPKAWWMGAGALAITLLFRFASLKLIDDRMLARRPAYRARMQRVPALLPRLRRS